MVEFHNPTETELDLHREPVQNGKQKRDDPHHTYRSRGRVLAFVACAAVAAALGLPIESAADNGVVDPFAVVAAVERASETTVWPGFDASAYPIAIYDGERTLLLRHPNPPQEFEPLRDHEGVWATPGRHRAMRWNSTADIGGVRTATLLLTIEPGRTVEYEAHILYHEIFHLFSKSLHPTWRPNEMWRYSYPMEDLENYRLLLLEEEALARAVDAQNTANTAAWASAALAIRDQRQTLLSEEHRDFETTLELQEGTAVYMGRSTIGTATETARLREDRGPEGIRWRCYETGAAISVILDRLLPSWKQQLDTRPETTFTELLEVAVARAEIAAATFSDGEKAAMAARAEHAIAGLAADRAALVNDFNRRGRKVVVRTTEDGGLLEFGRFDPMAVEILDDGEALQAHMLTASHPRGEVNFSNPHFVRRSLDGVIALTSPAGNHPFLYGYRQIAFAGFDSDPVVTHDEDTVIVEAEGLHLSFAGASIDSTDDEVVVTVPPGPEPSSVSPPVT